MIIEQLSFETAKNANTVESYRRYLGKYPAGNYVSNAKLAVEELEWRVACRLNTTNAFRAFLRDHPDGRYAGQARNSIQGIAWRLADSVGTHRTYQEFLRDYPSGPYSKQATERMAEALEWQKADSLGTRKAYQTYMERHPEGRHVGEAKHRLIGMGALGRSGQRWSYRSPVRVGAHNVPRMLAILSMNPFTVYPELGKRYSTELQKKGFRASAEGHQLERELVRLRDSLLQVDFSIYLPAGSLSEYSTKTGQFVFFLSNPLREGESMSLASKGWKSQVGFNVMARMKTLEGIELPSLPFSVYDLLGFWGRKLNISVPEAFALEIEQRKNNVACDLLFRLSPTVSKVEQTWAGTFYHDLYPRAKNVTLRLVDDRTNEVLYEQGCTDSN